AFQTLGDFLVAKVHHHDAVQHADLRRGKADAGGVVHGFQHVIHQGTVRVSHAAFDRFCNGLEDGQVGRNVDGQYASDSHDREVGSVGAKVKKCRSWPRYITKCVAEVARLLALYFRQDARLAVFVDGDIGENALGHADTLDFRLTTGTFPCLDVNADRGAA